MNMLIKFSIVTFLFLISLNQLFSDHGNKEIEISERIGFELKPDIKLYFNFFPLTENFKTGKLYKLNDSLMFFKIERIISNNIINDTLFLTTKDYINLKKILENYEYILGDGETDNPFGIIWSKALLKILQPRMRYYDDHNEIKFVLQDNSLIIGDLVWADSSLIIVTLTNTKFDWKDEFTNYKIYHYSEIVKFVSPGNKDFMGRKDIYLLNLEYLQKLSSFQETDEVGNYIKVPELTGLVQIKQSNFTVINEDKKENQLNLNELILSKQQKFIISINKSLGAINPMKLPEIALKNYSEHYDSNPINPGWYTLVDVFDKVTIPEMKTTIPEILLEYKISDHLNIGTGINLYETNFKYTPSLQLAMNMKGMTMLLFLNYTKKNHNLYSFDFYDNFEFSYVFGAILGNFNNEIAVTTIIDGELFTNVKNKLKYDNTVYGAFLELKLSYFITDFLTFDVCSIINIMTPTKTDNWTHKYNDYNVLMIEETSFYYSSVGIKCGLGVRL